jgi:mevalonate kinase
MKEFSVKTTGKWILAGEHSVLRGSPALVFPLESRGLELEYRAQAGPHEAGNLELALAGEHGEELQILFWGVLEKACELKKLRRSQFTGHVKITSRIPVGAGLGASAALCVAMSRWFSCLKVISEDEVAEFARTLENLFHGESSGVDIAIAMTGKPLRFRRGEPAQELPIRWAPKLYVSYSGQRGVTLECVNQVKRLFETQSERARALDERMRAAAAECEIALSADGPENFERLARAINEAGDCFREWGLVEGAPQTHMDWLKQYGAIATKPTGSGKGGYVLSLWKSEPPDTLKSKLISCFVN